MTRIKILELWPKVEDGDYVYPVSIAEVSEGTGIHRNLLKRMLDNPSYNATLETLDKLYWYFECSSYDDLLEWDEE